MSSGSEVIAGVRTADLLRPAGVNSSAANVYEINPLSDSRWETFIKSHPRSSVFHSTNWLKALQTTYKYDPLVVTTCPPDADLTNGLVFCRVNSWVTGRRLVSLPFSDHCELLVHNSNELDDLLLHMKRYVDAGRWKYIEIRPTSSLLGNQTGLGRNVTYSFHCLDLRKSTQELFHNFHKDCIQRKIRRAEREKLQYEEGTSEILLQKFYDLQVLTRRRQGLPPQPLSWFRGLVAAFGGDLKIRIATKDDLPVASILTLVHKKSMVYKYGCSDERFHRFGGMVFLFWNAIREAKDLGCEEFDMGRSDTDNVGLMAFKGHWGAVGTELSYWTYPQRPTTTISTLQKAVLQRLVSLTPQFALKTAGRLFYRHIG
jgi:lipid II:glycine glycyltransferase (peptidoglycan interpeptide bridge formation enzyme)